MLRSVLISAAIIVLFGIFVPLTKGLDFVDPLILSGCLILSLVIVAPAAASAFSRGEPAEGGAALRRLTIVTLYAWAMGFAVVVAGLITVNLRSHYRHAVLPEPAFFAAALACSAAATLFVGLLSALVARRYSAGAARNALRLVFLGMVLFLIALARFSGPDWPRMIYRWCTSSHLRTLDAGAALVLAIADAVLATVLVRGIPRPVSAE